MMSLFHLFSFAVLFLNSYTAPDIKPANIAAAKKAVHSLKEAEDYLPWANVRSFL